MDHLRAINDVPPISAPPISAPPISSFVFPLHAKSGTHHAYLYIGSPPQRQTLIVDTGSRLTAFPCRPYCSDSLCGVHASPRFDIHRSQTLSIVSCNECILSPNHVEPSRAVRTTNRTTCVHNQCHMTQTYTEGSSWDAIQVQDKVWLGSEDIHQSHSQHTTYSRPFVFGCQTSEHGLFHNQYADGIMGLSMYTQTIVGNWYHRGSVHHESFALCFHPNGGHLSLGGIGSSSRHRTPMQFVPLVTRPTWYYTVHVTSLSVGEYVLPYETIQFLNHHRGTIVDSGTTDTFLSHKIAKVFHIAWAKVVGRKYTNQLQLYTYEQFMKLPIIALELDGGSQWDVRPEAYMEAYTTTDATVSNRSAPWQGKRGFTSRIYVDEPNGAVLGSNFMMDHEVYFDTANRRMGIARSSCQF